MQVQTVSAKEETLIGPSFGPLTQMDRGKSIQPDDAGSAEIPFTYKIQKAMDTASGLRDWAEPRFNAVAQLQLVDQPIPYIQ